MSNYKSHALSEFRAAEWIDESGTEEYPFENQ